MSTISDIASLHLKYASELYLKRKVDPVFPFRWEHHGLIIPTKIRSQLLAILDSDDFEESLCIIVQVVLILFMSMLCRKFPQGDESLNLFL